MKLYEVKEILDAEVLSGEDKLDQEVFGACGADLMSDVLAWKGDKGVLLTGLTNPQVVRTAEVVGDVKCIVFVRGNVQHGDRGAGEGGRHCTDEMQISHVCSMWTIVLEGFST